MLSIMRIGNGYPAPPFSRSTSGSSRAPPVSARIHAIFVFGNLSMISTSWIPCFAPVPICRVYSPVAFPQKTDPDGEFVRYWIPQLKKFPKKYIYEPWNAPLSVQKVVSASASCHRPTYAASSLPSDCYWAQAWPGWMHHWRGLPCTYSGP